MPGQITVKYAHLNEEQLPIIDCDIDKVKSRLSKEFEDAILAYTASTNQVCKWKWRSNGGNMRQMNGYQIQQSNKNNIDLFKEQNKINYQKLKFDYRLKFD